MVASKPPLDPAWAAENNLPRILSITGIFHALALITVGLRLYVRIRLLRTPGSDDVVIVGSVLMALGGYICFVLQGYHGLGRHTLTISKPDMVAFDHIGFAQSVISAIGALGLLKISIALFLLRLSKNRWYTRSLWALIVFVSIYSFGAWLTFFLHCFPMEGHWDKSLNAKCYGIKLFITVALINTGFNIFTDVCFATLPIPIIWGLQMSKRTRINLIGVLSLGYLCVAFGIVKAVYQIESGKNKDKHFEVSLTFWGFLQLNMGIIAASIPTLKPLLRGSSGTTSGNKYQPYAYGPSGDKLSGAMGSRPKRSVLDTVDDRGYEMSGNISDGTKKEAGVNVYSVEGERTGSEDRILETTGVVAVSDKIGILRTTEVSIANVQKV